MKLKKIASLAMAGVLAVSMLAGCATNKPATSEPTTEEPTNDLSAAVIAALDDETTKVVDFTTDSVLDAAIQSAVAYAGTNGTSVAGISLSDLNKFYSELPTAGLPTAVTAASNLNTLKKVTDAVKTADGAAVITTTTLTSGASAEYVVKQLAKKIDGDVETYVPTESEVYAYTDPATNKTVNGRITYSYTGTVSLAAVPATDTGLVTYIAVYTLTRTGNAVEV